MAPHEELERAAIVGGDNARDEGNRNSSPQTP
jgi:hypothetical protein